MAKKEDREVTKQQEQERKLIRSRCNICEDDGKILLRLEMPGVKKENLDVNIENNQLKILGKREAAEEEGTYIIKERREGDFYQVYTLDETVDKNKVDATMENGVLLLTLYLKEAEKPKKIEIK
jgi:HSP20 family protein